MESTNSLEKSAKGGGYQRYCPDCKTYVYPDICETDDKNYHSRETSKVLCPNCGLGLGHIVWWPDTRSP